DPERSFVPVPLEPERRDTPEADLAVDEVTPTECLAVELERLVVESLAVVHRHRRPSALFGNGNPETRGQPGSNSCAIDAFQRRLSGVPLWGWPSGRGRAGKRPRYTLVRLAACTGPGHRDALLPESGCAHNDIAAPDHRVFWGTERETSDHEPVF